MAHGARSALECGGSSHRFSLDSQQLFIRISSTNKRHLILLRRLHIPRMGPGRKAVAAATAL